MKPETLLTLVERLDKELSTVGYSSKIHNGVCPTAILHGGEWPRLRDAIREMHAYLWNTREQRDDLALSIGNLPSTPRQQ